MKRILATIFSIFMIAGTAQAVPIVELAAPRSIHPDFTPSFVGSSSSTSTVTSSKSNVKKQKIVSKGRKGIIVKYKYVVVHPKKTIFKPNYTEISKAIEYGYYDYADGLLNKALASKKHDLKADTLQVVSLAKQSKIEPAQKKIDKLIKKYPNNSDLHYAQGLIYYQKTNSSNMDYRKNTENLYNDAMSEFEKAITANRLNAGAYNAAGVISIVRGNNKSARKFFENAIRADRTYSTAADNLGTLDFVDKNYPQAEKRFNEALKYNSQNSTAMYHLAQSMMQKQNYTKALYYLNNALALNPSSPAIFNLMGKAYVAQGNEAAAINAFHKSVSITPEFALSYIDLADIYQKRGDNEFAIEQLKTALDVNPEDETTKLKIADISYANGNYNQAIAYYSQLIGVDGYNEDAAKGVADSYYSQAQAYSGRGILETNAELFKAINTIDQAIALDNNSLDLHLAKLKLSKLLDQDTQTVEELNKIICIAPQTVQGLVSKGEAYLALDNYKDAKIAFDSASKLTKTTEDDIDLAEIFIYNKQYDNALKVLDKVMQKEPKNTQAAYDKDYIQKSLSYADNFYKSAEDFRKDKKYSQAEEYLSRTLAINPNNADAVIALGRICDKENNKKDALKNYKAYVGMQPKSFKAKRLQKRIKKLEKTMAKINKNAKKENVTL